MKCGPLPKKAPSITGKSAAELTKELWEAGVKVREDVEEVVKSFLNMVLRAEETVSMFVIGEWGEGKTSVFDGYMKTLAPEDKVLLLETSAKRLVSSVRAMKPMAGQSSAVAFTAALLHSIAMEYLERGEELIPPYEGGPLHEYAKKALDELMKRASGRRIIVFIDEFEEIVSPSNKDVVKEVINGLIDLINGQFGYLQEKYPGSLHLVIAMTPYAYHKALSLAEIDESLKGRAERRLHFKLELRPLTRTEGYKLVSSIFKYAYGKEYSPVPHQFVNTLYTASQGNPGALTSLTNFLMSSLVEGDCTVEPEDPRKLVSILSRATVFTYVGSSKALDELYYEKALLPLTYGEEDFKKVLATIAAYYYPLTEEELKELSGVQDAKEKLEILDQRASMNDEPLVSKYWRTKDYQKAFKVLVSTLKTLFPDLSEESIKELVEALTFPSSLWKEEYYLALPGEGDEEIIEEILSKEIAAVDVRKLIKYLKEKMEAEGVEFEESYVLARKRALNLYPPPAVAAVSFIKDPQMRAKAWKEALNALIKGNVKLDKAFAEVIIESTNATPLGKMVGVELKKGVYAKVYPKVLLSFEKSSLEKLAKNAKKEGAHLLMILTKTELVDQIKNMAKILPIDVKVLEAREAKLVQLATYVLYSTPERRIYVDVDKAKLMLKQIGEEIGVPRAISEWIEEAKERGIIVEDLQRPSGASEETIAEAYSFYLAYPKDTFTTEEVFEHVVKKIRRFIVYGRGSRRRTPFASGLDIENPRGLKRFEEDLIAADLLERIDDKLKIKLSKVEKRMIELLKQKRVMPWKELEREFIIASHNKRLLSDFYLKILERRGLVKVERRGNEPVMVSLTNTKGLVEELENWRERVEERWRNYGSGWRSYAHVVVSKKKEDNVIFLDEIRDYINKGTEELRYERSSTTIARRAAFLTSLARYLIETLVPVTEKAYLEAQRLVDDASKSMAKIMEDVEKVLDRVSEEVGVAVLDTEDIDEVVKLKMSLRKLEEMEERRLKPEEIEKEVKRLRREGLLPDLFYFERFYDPKEWKRSYYFNVKYYLLSKASDEFYSSLEDIRKSLTKVERYLNEIKEAKERMENKLKELAVKGRGDDLASRVYSVLINGVVSPPENVRETAIDTLADLERTLEEVVSSVRQADQKILSIVMKLNEIASLESELSRQIKIAKSWCTFAKNFYSNSPYQEPFSELCERVRAVEAEYNSLAKDLGNPFSTIELMATLERLKSSLRDLISEVKSLIGEMKGIYQESVNEIEKKISEINRMKTVADKLNIRCDDVVKMVMNVRVQLNNMRPPGYINTSYTYESLLSTLERAKTLLSLRLKTKLSNEEEKLLELLEGGKRTLEEVLEKASAYGLDKENALKALVKLSEKGLVRVLVEVA